MQLVIKNGLIADSKATYKGDIGIENGRIAVISAPGTLSGDKEINAEEKIVMPGAIDVHTHFQLPIMNSSTADDFESGSRACAAGGVTSFIDFVTQIKGHSLIEDLEMRRKEADPNVYIDYSLHMGITDFTKETIASIKEIIKEGIPSFKIFMAYSKEGWMAGDGDLLDVLEETSRHGGFIGVHAENQSIIDRETDLLLSQGKSTPAWFSRSRPHSSEVEALRRIIYLTELVRSKAYIFHLSTGEGARLIAEARGRGVDIKGETCPHYLTLDERIYEKNDGWLYPSCPPLRTRFDAEVLWRALYLGTLDNVATDHCSFTRDQKEKYKNDFTMIPRGLPGCETLLPLVYTYGVKKGKISLEKMVDVLCASPAKIFGMYPIKGSLAIGSDADIAVIDPNKGVNLTSNDLHMKAGYSPYEGMELLGFPDYTISRGEIIYDKSRDEFPAARGRGRFVKRSI